MPQPTPAPVNDTAEAAAPAAHFTPTFVMPIIGSIPGEAGAGM
jgi:hypothetical protein